MKNLIFIFIIILESPYVFTQAPDTLWTRKFGGKETEYSRSFQRTFDGAYVLAVTKKWPTLFLNGISLIKINDEGNIIWEKDYLSNVDDEVWHLEQTKDSGFIITGAQYPYRLLIWKFNQYGDTLWTKYLDYYFIGLCIKETFDGGFIISGVSPTIIKVDSLGNEEWHYNGQSISQFRYVIQTRDSNFVAVGTGQNFGTVCTKIDKVGNELWTKAYDLNGVGYCVQELSDNSLILCGYNNNNIPDSDVKLIKTNEIGDSLWSKPVLGSQAWSVKELSDGGFILCGFGFGGHGLLIRVNEYGYTQWIKDFGNGYLFEVVQNKDLAYLTCGYVEIDNTEPNTLDVWFIKTLPNLTDVRITNNILINNFLCEQNYPNPFNPLTKIKYKIPKLSNVCIKVFNLLGSEVVDLVNEEKEAGEYIIEFNATDLPSGVYFYQIKIGNFIQTRKMILMK